MFEEGADLFSPLDHPEILASHPPKFGGPIDHSERGACCKSKLVEEGSGSLLGQVPQLAPTDEVDREAVCD